MSSRIFLSVLLVVSLTATSTTSSGTASAKTTRPATLPLSVLLFTPTPKPDKDPDIIPYCIAAGHLPDACATTQSVIFVIGLSDDVPTRSRLVGSLTDQLDGYSVAGRLIAEPTWTTADFINQCKSDRKFANRKLSEGALVIAAVGLAGGVEDAFSQTNSKQEAGVNVLYAECNLVKSAPEPVYGYIWSSHTQTGRAWKHQANTARYISMVTGLLSLAGLVLSVLPTSATKTTTTTTFATPTSPTPPATFVSSVVSERDTQGASFSSLAAALLATAVTNSTVTPTIPADDTQAWNAIEGAVYNVVSEMHCTPLPPGVITPRASPSPNSDVAQFADKMQVSLQGPAPFCK